MLSRRGFIKLATIMPLFALMGCSGKKGIEVMYAASLQNEMEDGIIPAFERKAGIDVYAEAKGSVTIINLVKDGYRRPDVVISADASLLDELKGDMIGNYAIFASNSIVIAHRGVDIDRENWIDVLLSGKYRTGMSDPLSDPLGYRTLLTLKLAELHYGCRFYDELVEKMLVFGLETDLLANLRAGTVDVAFLYKNMASTHSLSFLPLPEQIDLSSPDYQDFYQRVEVRVGDRVYKGRAILYGIAATKWAGKDGIDFVSFMLGSGRRILEEYGFNTMVRWGEDA
jgi:molybdate/tungstate transport system substrate-binding protein